jgi:lipopolysaccharide transport system permease protein
MRTFSPKQKWTAVITSKKPLLDLQLGELWQYRDMTALMVRRDIIATFKQTILGPVWYLIQPVISSVVFTIIFSGIGKISTNGIPPFLFYLSGNLIWYYFSSCLTSSSNTFRNNASLFQRVYFPRLAVPLSQSIVNLWTFGIQALIFAGFYLHFLWSGAPITPSYRVVIIPFLILQCALLGLGVGCLISAMTTRYRDLQIAVAPMIQLWMYASCVIFPRSSVPEHLQWLMTLNPVVSIVETFRFALMGQGQVEIYQWIASVIITLVLLIVGLVEFNRAERTMADTI